MTSMKQQLSKNQVIKRSPVGHFLPGNTENPSAYDPAIKAQLKQRFIELYYKLGSQTMAAERIGLAYDTIKSWRYADPEFKETCGRVQEALLDRIEDGLTRIAMNPTNQAGVTAAALLLNARRSKFYKRSGAGGDGDTNVSVNLIVGKNPTEAKRLPSQSGDEIVIDAES